MDGDFILPSADIQSITRLEAPTLDEQPTKSEAAMQTDPVTIIIGDASFLVEKLKGKTIKTEKKQREYEIELEENGSTETVKSRSRTGYIPGAGLNHNFGTPPFKGRIPLDKLKSTPVAPFNPKATENIRLLRGDVFTDETLPIVQPEPSPIASKEPVTSQEPVQQALSKESPVTNSVSSVSQAVSQAVRTLESGDADVPEPTALSCPFCESLFYEAPELYQHITEVHNEQRQEAHHQPKGRSLATPPPPPRSVSPPSSASPRLPAAKKFTPSSLDDDDDMPDYVKASVQYYRQLALAEGKTPPGSKLRKSTRKETTTSTRKETTTSTNRRSPKASESQSSPAPPPKFQAMRAAAAASKSSYQAPPVLEPVYLVDTDGHQQFTPSRTARTYKRQAPKVQAEPNLFEDLPEPKRAFPRGRVRRDEQAAAAQLDAYEYECPHCPERYGSASSLYTHLKRSHRHQLDEQRGGPGTVSEDDEEDAQAAAAAGEEPDEQAEQEQPAEAGDVAAIKSEKDASQEEEADAEATDEPVNGTDTDEVQADAVEETQPAEEADAAIVADEGVEEAVDAAIAEEASADAEAEAEDALAAATTAVKRKRRSSASTPKGGGKKSKSDSADDDQQQEEVTSPDEQPTKRATRARISRTRKPRTPFE